MKRTLITQLLAASALTVAVSADDRPNILFVMSDDHASRAIGVYESRLKDLNPTPNIDSFAKQGMVMENAFCNNAICTPSRASIMTGQYSYTNGVTGLNHPLKSGRHYLSKEFKNAGYQTAVIGKWHLKTRPENFDYYKVLPGQGSYNDPVFYESGKEEEEVQMIGHSSDCITDSAIAWLEQRDKTKPFFLKYHFKAPHAAFKPADRYKDYLKDVKIPEPASLYDHGNHGSLATVGHNGELRPLIGTSVSSRHAGGTLTRKWGGDTSLPEAQRTSNAYQEYMHLYLRCVKGIDDNFQRMVDYLKKENIYDNTVIIYTADQGFFLGEHDYTDKRWAYEESMRMPFIIRYPKSIKAGTRSDAIVENVDYGPTMLDFAGIKTPEYMHGKSFKHILETGEEPADWKKSAYYHYWFHMMHHYNPAHFAIRTKKHKLIMFYGARGVDTPDTPPAWELYDLSKDPFEMNNVYDNPEYAAVVADLKEQLKERRAFTKDDDPKLPINKIINEYWDYDDAAKQKAIAISNERASRPFVKPRGKKTKADEPAK